ncbi:MAG TPA: GxxExxY protein [Povalibacter sp.]|nr:GxxExxY protein [Povalibacter sp.]
MDDIRKLCDAVRETAFAVHTYFRHGHLEKVYENALAHRLRVAGMQVTQQQPLSVFDKDGTNVGQYFADIVIEEFLIVEIKAVGSLCAEHQAQLLGYLRSARVEHGLLINFGSRKFQIRKYVLSAVDAGPTILDPL